MQLNAALFISTLILEELELTKDDIESGSVTAQDLLSSCLIPDAARLTGVFKGTRANPLLEAVPAVTIVGSHSAALVGETVVLGAKLKAGAEASFEDLLAEMDEEDEVTLADCIGSLAPNLLAAFGSGKSKREAFADDLLSGRVISLPASLIDINGTNNRPFIVIEPRDDGSGAAKMFVALELSDEHTRHLQDYTLTLLEVRTRSSRLARARAARVRCLRARRAHTPSIPCPPASSGRGEGQGGRSSAEGAQARRGERRGERRGKRRAIRWRGVGKRRR
jgi:hypothetical protein